MRPKYKFKGCGGNDLDRGGYELPSLLEVFCGSRHLKIVNMYAEKEAKLLMEVARWPYSLSNVQKTNGLERCVTMMLPIGSGVGVPVHGDPQTTNQTSHPLPAGWPLVLRDTIQVGLPLNSAWRYA